MNTERAELRWVVTVAVIALVVALIPTLVALLAPPANSVYTGISSTAPGDVSVYLSYLEQARQGHLVFQDLFTSATQQATLLNPFWLALGLIGGLFHIAPLATYLIARVALGIVLLAALWWCCAFFFSDRMVRRTAYLLAVFASGIGAWFMPLLDARFRGSIPEHALPMDLWVSEAFTFLTLRHSPHFIAATLLIVLSIVLMIRSVERGSRRDALLAGVSMLGLFSFHPFHVVSLGLITLAWGIVCIMGWAGVPRGRAWYLVLSWSIAVPAVLYHVLTTVFDPVSSGRAAQNILLTTKPLITLASYGFLIVGAALGGRYLLIRQRSTRTTMLVVWGIAHALSIYVPIFFNRRLTHGLNIALALLAAPFCAAAVRWMLATGKKRTTNVGLVIALAVALFGTSNLWIFAQDLSFVAQKGRSPTDLFYVNKNYRDAFRWLEQHGDTDTVVLCGVITGNLVPGWTGRRVVIGHTVETLDFNAVKQDVATFFTDGTEDAWRMDYLKRHGITHVLVGYRERARITFDPERAAYLTPVYRNATTTVYRVSL